MATLERARKELAGVRLENLSPEANLFGGPGSALDSLTLVSFIFILEDEIERATGTVMKVSTNDILSKTDTPFRNLKTLRDWLQMRLPGSP